MGVFNPGANFVDDAVLTAAALNAKFQAARDAVNALATGNLENDAIPLISLDARETVIPVFTELIAGVRDCTFEIGVIGTDAVGSFQNEYLGYLGGADYTLLSFRGYLTTLDTDTTEEPRVQLSYLDEDRDRQVPFGPELNILQSEWVGADKLAIPVPRDKQLYVRYYKPPFNKGYYGVRLSIHFRAVRRAF